MGKRLFIGNLSPETKDEDLQKAFADCGKVLSVQVIKSKFDPSQSRGFGFVEMESETDAKNAVSKMNGAEINGRKIAVEEAKPLNRDSRPGGGGGGGGSGRPWGGDRSGGGRRDSNRRW
ncbi:MAG: RNA-binding protein [Elusimicrobia bacterium]|nr:RNA-binding protein [Elusimicrobiota bacterium]